MKTLKVTLFFQIMIVCLILLPLTACGKPSPTSLGIEKSSRGIWINLDSLKLSVYGTGKINAANKTAQIKILTSDLSKINTSYSVNLILGRENLFSGKIKSIPDARTIGNNTTFTIEASLDNSGDLSVWDNTEMDAFINLPSRDGVFVVYNYCIVEGNDGKKYLWASKKKYNETNSSDNNIWELTEVETGEDDGKKIEVTKGLNGYQTIFVPIKTPN